MKKAVTGVFVIALLVCLSSAYAGAGDSNDPLISKSWIDDTYTEKVISAGESAIEKELSGVYDKALSTAESEYGRYSTLSGDYNFSSGSDLISMSSGSSVTMVTGGSFILLSGSGTVTVSSGTVINVSTGQEVSSGAKLTKDQRYFCAEDTTAVFKASEASSAAVNGAWKPSSGVTLRTDEYTDVAVTDWFYDEVMYVKENELFYDINGAKFRPRENADRATFVYALWKAAGAPKASKAADFRDLTEDWYKSAVAWAVESGVTNGYGDGRFGPSDTLTREQIAVFMYRFAVYKGRRVSASSNLTGYTDRDDISSWALKEMKWANAAGIIKGTTETTLSPQGTATRAEVATIVMRFIEN